MVQAGEIRDPLQPPAFALKKFQQAKYKNRVRPVNTGVKVKRPAAKPLKLTSILYSPSRKNEKKSISKDNLVIIYSRPGSYLCQLIHPASED